MALAKTVKRYLKHTFTEPEMLSFRDTLASTICELSQLEDEKKTVTSQYAAKINEKKATSNMAAQNIRNGYEYRDIECDIFYDLKRRMKTIARKDNGEFIEELPMTAEELQCSLPGFEEFDEEPEPATVEPEIDEDDFIEQMNNAETADVGRDILKRIETRIHDLQVEAGCAPMVGQVEVNFYRGIGVLTKKELGKLVKEASRANPAIGQKLSIIVDQLPTIKEIFDQLLLDERKSLDVPTPDELILGTKEEETNPDPDESEADNEIDENPSF